MDSAVKPLERVERKFCLQCFKAQLTCYCSQLRPFRTQRLQLVILQHPLERRKSIGTARMAHRCIENSLFLAGVEFSENPDVNRLMADPDNYCVVLYPGESSKNIGVQGPQQVQSWFPSDRHLVIFVIDGTWSCARKMLLRSRNLSRLAKICFTADQASEYRIRRQPGAHCLSTIEAVHRLLEILDPAVDPGNLMTVFKTMVQQQLLFSDKYRIRRSPGS